MDIKHNKVDEIDKEIGKINIIVSNIQSAINSKDEQQLKSYIGQFVSNIRKLLKENTKDRFRYLISQYLNRIMFNFPTVRVNACVNLNDSLNRCLDEVKFEKQALLELRSYLKSCTKDKNYDNLDLAFGILVVILGMHNERNGMLSIDGDIWKCGISGIEYIPATVNDRTDTLKTAINVGLTNLSRKKVKK